MLTYREELELHVTRERHMACLIGCWLGFVAALGFVMYGLCFGKNFSVAFGLFDVALSAVFFACGRRPLRRIRELEELDENIA